MRTRDWEKGQAAKTPQNAGKRTALDPPAGMAGGAPRGAGIAESPGVRRGPK